MFQNKIYYLVIAIVISVMVGFYIKHKYYTQRIPKIIIQTWKTDIIPAKYTQEVNSVKTHHPTYEYLFFTDDAIEIFLETHYPEYYETYKKLPKQIQRIDFFRYIAVYHYGGFYLDLDIEVHKPFDELLHHTAIFPIDLHIKPFMCDEKYPRFQKLCKSNQKIMIGQYAFGAIPQHPFIKELIDDIHNNIDIYIQKFKEDKSLQYVYETTGPDFVTYKYLDTKPADITILYHKEGQHFGSYATHNYYGTWK